ncbi:MAG: glycosyltransferase family 2 protein [Arcanobacterium sp.]|nr:glycosyltransferase family 2 protein [Arcanobacterium sp.]MDY5589222.1 glycosyltransferase [Arcanobacterium sp.]
MSERVLVEIVVAIHQENRPIERAVASILACPEAGAIVVAHGLDPQVLEERFVAAQLDIARIRIVPCSRGIGYPGVPFNAGIAAAQAPWVGIMGSDDWFEEGALAAYRHRAELDSADGVIAPLLHPGVGKGHNPLTVREKHLDPVRDRLFYRTAPLGIFRREILQNSRYAFDEEVHSGEDISVSARLWSSGLQISYSYSDPAYVVGNDAQRRVTLVPRPMAEIVRPWRTLWEGPFVCELDRSVRFALAVKQARVDVLGVLHRRPQMSDWTAEDFDVLSQVLRAIKKSVPEYKGVFRTATARVLTAVESGNLDAAIHALAEEKRAPLLHKVLTANPLRIVHRESPLGYFFAGKMNEIRGGHCGA